ncbi:amidohydrolase [Sandaracinobacter sp. RS1-74]|uniref:amidohydrolase n=1 Tax=Sandaracinobacteroides sayramensis TaxID=2913411 RepID=UPI001EDC1FE2|nr:amidohydrolase [Sandaracinobacteroides sayramensis]MCG2841019.1 amidohydrolase [Sandaracinobacteroides sayramensis]
MRIAAIGLLAALLAGCATTGGGQTSATSTPPSPSLPGGSPDAEAAVASTYRAWPGVPTVIRNVTIYDGKGGRIDNGAVRFEGGKLAAVGRSVDEAGATVIDGAGKWVTPGIIDIHSHLGDYPSPGVPAHSDGNEITGPVRPEVWAIHSVWPQDPGFGRALAGGVTVLHVLPGSANLFGGRGATLKNVYGRTAQDMLMPGAPWSLKMACGENPKRVYGSRNQMPGTRMGNVAMTRQTWANARDYQAKLKTAKGPQKRDMQMETLAGVLDGKILVQHHCYRADEMANIIQLSKEFGYKVTAFHHAVEAYKINDLLKAEGICAALWADWWGFKMESYDGIQENLPFMHAAGGCAITHSDDADGIQRLNQETAKALGHGRRMGLEIRDEEAWTWLAINPAKALGIADKVGSLEPGKQADVVLWNGDPLSVYSRPEKVWVDGALLYDTNDPKRRPVSDFELGQPGEGDRK